jgi:hypothetical protein
MADYNKIENTHKQEGSACVLTSYSIIMNYFSNDTIPIKNILEEFIKSFGQKTPNDEKTRDDLLRTLYFNNCPNNINGFVNLADYHCQNRMQTKNLCRIIGIEADGKDLDITIRAKLREDIKNNDRLAMVLTDNGNHAIVLGYDNNSKRYFVRNPQKCPLKKSLLYFEDFLNLSSGKDIREFILFERR